jgi:phosphoglycolate phosphatase
VSDHRFRLIVFDVDGTLVDSQHVIFAAMGSAFAEAGLEAPGAAAVRAVVGLGLEEAMAHLSPGAAPEQHRRLSLSFRAAADALRRRPDYVEPLFPGVREALAALGGPAVFLGIATGKARRGLDHTLASHGIAALFHTLQTADRNPSKPDPAMLLKAMEEVGAGPSETVLIGDTVFDMAMADRARTAAVGVAWGYHPREDLRRAGAQRIIEAPAELASVLASLGV